MSKKKKHLSPSSVQTTSAQTDIGRGTINDNFLKALVTSKVYKTQVVKARKGKGAFKRKEKHLGRESYLMAA
ncbi:ribosome alternative rescue factor ArfA [Aliivibrio kagoshimensis]|uniref:ribosome alternative rescue factor ArfA n=1 Tax=Aliivibrio kagoshimensis TaxID=2910230 RepID=UPI003D12DC5D